MFHSNLNSYIIPSPIQISEGIEYCQRAVALEDNPMKARAFLTMGVGYSLKAEEAHLQVNRKEYQTKALNVFCG